jgi:hypothetical protein
MKLPAITMSVTLSALLASASAIGQEAPPRPGGARTPSEEIKLLPPEQAGKPAAAAAAQEQGERKRLPQPDNPLDPNQPRRSDKEPAKIKPAENAAIPAENAKKVLSKEERQARKAAREAKKAADAKDGKPAKETAKIKPAENAVPPAENTDKVKAKEGKEAKEKQASRRAVPMLVDTMPGAPATLSYGPRLTPQPKERTSLPATAATSVRPLAQTGPAIVNSCDAGGCTDTNGVRYNAGAGNTMLSPDGKLCHHTGVTMQC